MNDNKQGTLSVSLRSYVTAIAVILVLMTAAYLMTLTIPGGEYARVTDESGRVLIDTAGGFTPVKGGIPFGRWLLSPVLALFAPGGSTLIAVLAFLLVIGGVFTALDRCGMMAYMLDRIAARFGAVRYHLVAVCMLFFMAMGAMIGSFEECVPMVPIAVALSVNLGFDALTGVTMSLLAAGCGFASGVCNPFTVGVAQQLAGLPMFSGVSMRLLSFALIYALLLAFTLRHARRIAKTPALDAFSFTPRPAMDRALLRFALLMGAGVGAILFSGLITALQDYTMIIVAAAFLLAGVTACLTCGMGARPLLSAFLSGACAMLPAAAMIMMASSIRFTLEQAHILDTLLHGAVRLAQGLPGWAAVLFVYLIVLAMNFFIPSGSAKAFMLIPLIVPMAQVFGVSAQLCVLAFAFGDGFSNVLYPTNPALLIGLSLAGVSYSKWFRFSLPFQLMNLLLTCLLLLLGYAVGY